MPQVSRFRVNQEIEKRMFEIFEKTLADLKAADQIKSYLGDLLTPTEKIMLSKRLAIAVLLAKGYNYRTISGILKVSTSTVLAIVKRQLVDGRGLGMVTKKILKEEETKKFFVGLEKTLAKILNPHPAVQEKTDYYYQKKMEKLNCRPFWSIAISC